MPKYDFHLRSGHTVMIELVGPMSTVVDSITRALASGEHPENQWISQPGFDASVRWTDVEGWQPHDDGRPIVTTNNPNMRADPYVPDHHQV